ncbi:MAG: cytochrome o ubiquinol oxidase subunit [Nevskia sp.]|nr:cytochrome o ubiquinol oxidase subunit [Nevskia sp.]
MSTHATDAMNAPPAQGFYLTEEHHPENGTMLGFWIYLMSDCLLFAVLFAMYGVLGGNYAAGPGPKDLFELPTVLLNTSMLLLSSITYGFAMLEMARQRKGATLLWLAITGCFGVAFVSLELTEFAHFIHDGAGPQRSAFLSSFFAVVGCHGVHVTAGLLWLGTMMAQIQVKGFRPTIQRRMLCFNLFWHTLDIIWVALFTVVYMLGAGA